MAAQLRTKNRLFEPCKKVITPEVFEELLEVQFALLCSCLNLCLVAGSSDFLPACIHVKLVHIHMTCTHQKADARLVLFAGQEVCCRSDCSEGTSQED